MPLRVVIVDDDSLFRSGLRALLEEDGIEVAGEAGAAGEALDVVGRTTPDVVTVEPSMLGTSGLEATEPLGALAAAHRVLVVSATAEMEDVARYMGAGACGYMTKGASEAELLAGVRAAAAGLAVFSPSIATALAQVVRLPAGDDGHDADRVLSERELEVLRLVAEGKDNAEIAHALYISSETVKNHVSKILAKLQVDNRIQAAVHAVRSRLV